MLFESLESRRLLSAAVDAGVENLRQGLDLDASWKFIKSNPTGAQNTSFNDSSWGTVSLPHTWNAQDGQDGGDNYYRGTGWYRKKITVPSSFSGKRIYLNFEG